MKKYHTLLYCRKCQKKMQVRNDYLKKHTGVCLSCQNIGNQFALKHGDYKERLYKIWIGLFHRRYRVNPNVCIEWHSYINFKNWALSNGYKNNLTIDRIDNKGHYEPLNCQWISLEQNAAKDKIIWNDEEKIKAYYERVKLNITQKEYATLKGVSRNTVQRAEKFAKQQEELWKQKKD